MVLLYTWLWYSLYCIFFPMRGHTSFYIEWFSRYKRLKFQLIWCCVGFDVVQRVKKSCDMIGTNLNTSEKTPKNVTHKFLYQTHCINWNYQTNLLMQGRVCGADIRERIRINNMPVQHVEFAVRQCILQSNKKIFKMISSLKWLNFDK